MASGVLLGIDLGTTVLKVAAFDGESGRMKAFAARRLSVAASADGKREQDTADIDLALRHTTAEVANPD